MISVLKTKDSVYKVLLIVVLSICILGPFINFSTNNQNNKNENNSTVVASSNNIVIQDGSSSVALGENITQNVLCNTPCDAPW